MTATQTPEAALEAAIAAGASGRKLRLFASACWREALPVMRLNLTLKDRVLFCDRLERACWEADAQADGEIGVSRDSQWIVQMEAPAWAAKLSIDPSHPDNSARGSVADGRLAELLADHFGAPWVTGQAAVAMGAPDVVMLAGVAYGDRESDGSLRRDVLMALSDALEENGCGGPVLGTLRAGRRQYRGLLVIDHVLGKEVSE